MKEKKCKWKLDMSNGSYDAECGLKWEMSNFDGLKENQMNYCPKCGCKIDET